MSSAIGHSVTALSIVVLGEQHKGIPVLRIGWPMWLIGIAILPDLDYFVEWLRQPAHNMLRVSHSLLGCLVVPLLTIALLLIIKVDRAILPMLGTQAVLAGISHLVLDMLVGVTGLPLTWPVSQEAFRLPFGILPSAGAIELSNYYLYRNLLIEMGALVPLYCGMYVIKSAKKPLRWRSVSVVVLWAVSVTFMYWGYKLPR